MSTLAISSPRAGRALFVAGLVAVAVLCLGATVASAEQTSAEFSEKYNAGVTAFKAHDMGKALAAAKEAKAVAKSGFEKVAAANLMVNVAGASGKFADEAEALEQLLASDSVPAASKGPLHKALAGAYAQTGKLDKALTEMKEAMKGGGSAADNDMLATLYFGARDCKNGLEALDKALAGGKEANEQQLKAKDSCYFQMKNQDRLLATAEELMRRFPKKDWYNQVLSINQERKIDDLAILAMLRYGFEHDYLDNESDFLKLADRALDVGTTAEAQRVLEKAISKKVIKKMEKADGLLKQAKDRAVEDAKTAAQLDAEAHAGKNGDTDYRLGMRYFSMKQYDKAADALQRALSPERVARVKRPDDANMVLGISLLKLNKKADADKAFNAAKADNRMAAAAKMWLGA
jgi:tetratricopeptide (TPR) repeat protein